MLLGSTSGRGSAGFPETGKDFALGMLCSVASVTELGSLCQKLLLQRGTEPRAVLCSANIPEK